MTLTQVGLRAPGIHAMVNGQPWTVTRNQCPGQLATRTLQLESIQTIIQSSQRDADLPPSPISIASGMPLKKASNLSGECFKIEDVENPVGSPSKEKQSMPLIVPEVARISAGGCFDPDNWIFKIVWDHVQHMSVEQLMINFFRREDRGEYGEHHTSTRNAPGYDCLDDSARLRGSSSENHRQQEQGRRVRHRYFQKEADMCTSDESLEMAQKNLPRIKRIIQTMHKNSQAEECGETNNKRKDGNAQNTKGTSRKLGKDDQLAAVLMSLYTAFVLIFRLQENLSEAREEIQAFTQSSSCLQVAFPEIKHRQGISQVQMANVESTYWRRKYEKLESESRILRGELMTLREQVKHEGVHRGLATQCDRPLLPLPKPSARRGKRSIGQLEDYVMATSPPEMPSEPKQAKRSWWTFERQHRLPPSPTPSWEESTSPSLSSS